MLWKRKVSFVGVDFCGKFDFGIYFAGQPKLFLLISDKIADRKNLFWLTESENFADRKH